MVSPQQEEVFRILDFIGEKKTDSFQRVLSTIDIISQKEVVRVGRIPSVFEQSQKVVVLAVDVSSYFQRGFQFNKDRLLEEDLPRLYAEPPDLVLCEINLLPGPAALH